MILSAAFMNPPPGIISHTVEVIGISTSNEIFSANATDARAANDVAKVALDSR